jgi:hypothetical protein
MFLDLSLRKKQVSEEIITFAPGLTFRIVFAIIAGFVLLGMGITGVFSTVPFIFALVCILVTVYNEQWLFDKKRGIIEHRFGLLPLFKRKTIAFTDVASFEYVTFLRGSISSSTQRKQSLFQKTIFRFSVVTQSGDKVVIETGNVNRRYNLQSELQQIAEFCSVPLHSTAN